MENVKKIVNLNLLNNMNRIDFENTKPTFINDDFEWYLDEYLQKYIQTQQAENLPKLSKLEIFVVKGKDILDYVLIDDKKNVITHYTYNREGFEQMQTRINIMKISKHFDEYERNNI